jgi:protein-tyrosine phosphatase
MLENIIHRDATTTSATTTTTTTALWDAIENENGDIDSIHEQQQQQQPQQQIIMKTKLLEQGKRVRQILQQQFDCSNPPLSTTTTTTTKSQHDMIEYYSSSQSMYHPSSYTKRNHQRGFSNWILKQYIMIGQYPGQTPEKDGPSLSSVKRHIESLLFATAADDDDVHANDNDNDDNNKNNNNHHHDIIISTKKNIGFLFCSLQDEIPSQTDYTSWKKQKTPGRIYLSWESGRREFPHYFGHYEPIVMDVFLKKKKQQQQQQQQQSISTMRNNRNRKMMMIKKKKKKKKDLSRNHEDNAHYDDDNFASSSSSSPSFLHMPIIDLSTPNSSSLYQTLSTLLQTLEDHHQLNSNSNSNNDHHHNAIYIHCWGGRGRAGLIGSCLLSILFPELSAEYILDWIQRGYNTRLGSEYMPVGLRKSPQTYTQREFVCNFVKEMQMMTMMMMDTDT